MLKKPTVWRSTRTRSENRVLRRVKCNSLEGVLFLYFLTLVRITLAARSVQIQFFAFAPSQCGRAVRVLGLQFGGPKSHADRQLICSRYSQFKFSTTFVKSQLVCLRPVGILIPIVYYCLLFCLP